MLTMAPGVLKVMIGAFEVTGVSGGALKVATGYQVERSRFSRTLTGAIEVIALFKVGVLRDRAALLDLGLISAISDRVRLSTELACRRPF
jgi:hypothetical protein